MSSNARTSRCGPSPPSWAATRICRVPARSIPSVAGPADPGRYAPDLRCHRDPIRGAARDALGDHGPRGSQESLGASGSVARVRRLRSPYRGRADERGRLRRLPRLAPPRSRTPARLIDWPGQPEEEGQLSARPCDQVSPGAPIEVRWSAFHTHIGVEFVEFTCGLRGRRQGSRFAWEADTLPAELLPLGRRRNGSVRPRGYHSRPLGCYLDFRDRRDACPTVWIQAKAVSIQLPKRSLSGMCFV